MQTRKRLLSLLLCGAMLFSLCTPSVYAEAQAAQDSGQITGNAGGLCEHHPEHNGDCGYSEGSEGTPCNHQHSEDCYKLMEECTHQHTADCYPAESVSDNTATPSNAVEREPENCGHVCSKEDGCITENLNCQHGHDNECGYVPATEGAPCTFVCEECKQADENTPEEPETDCICTALCTIEAVNEDCPVCGAEAADLALCKGKAETTPSSGEEKAVTVESV